MEKQKEIAVSQNLISLTINEDQQATALAALAQLEAVLPGLISLEPAQRRTLLKMGPKTETFARGTLRVLAQNPQIVPPSLDLAAAQGDLVAYDRLRPIHEALSRINAKVASSALALGHDIMDVAFDGYAQLKISGHAHGLEGLRRELGSRFNKRRKNAPAER